MEAKNPIKATRTTFRLLENLKELDGGRVTELASELGMSKSNVHNYLMTLMEEEYVVKEGDEYHVAMKFLDIGEYARSRTDIFSAACPELDKLADESGEWASLLVEEHGRGTYVYIAEGEQAVPGKTTLVGSRIYLHTTSMGKAILAYLPEERIWEIIDRHGLPKLTENTISEPDDLFQELEKVREQGFARDNEERRSGFRCVGGPIKKNGNPIGAISVTGPSRRLQGDRWETTVPELVLETTNVIEINMEFSE